ncbi:hypothetical protein CFC21_062985 [Triticum aestivum]|uniref:Thaumatin-like protein n=2 Tax=Triticum aestivum TaxID=4565 RepID=A0A9R1KIQ0_WHEAT|nr:hypothetical protein CFC21_062985 [Triticum aestivum]
MALLPPLLLSCILVLALPGPAVLMARGVTFHVTNKCPFPVWPAVAPNAGHPVLAAGGFFLPPGQSKRVGAPATWNGRFWGRTGCNFPGTGCLTGDCEGRLACNGSVGAPPATLVEGNLHEDQSKGSSYDVSVVDGYNLPVAVWTRPANRSGDCFIAGCAKNVNAVCPPELQVTSGTGKKATVVACRSACLAFGLDAFCCRGDVPGQRLLAALQGRLPGLLQLRLRAGVRGHILPVQMGRSWPRFEQCVQQPRTVLRMYFF